MKRVITLCLIAAISLQLMACSVSGNRDAWIEEGKGKIGSTLDCGQFVVNGDVYSFPADIADWTEHGWHISNNYENKDTYKLERDYTSNEFELFNDEASSQYVTMEAINNGSEPELIEDCAINYLKIKMFDSKDNVQIVLPGGITCKSSKGDIIAAYGEPETEDDNTLGYEYTSSDDWIVAVEIRLIGDHPDQVRYYLSDKNWGYIGNAQDCERFVDNALKTSFYGDYTEYVKDNFDTEEGAQELYESEVEYYAEGVMYYLDIDYEIIDPAIADGFVELSRQVLSKFKWDAPVADLADGASYGTVELTMYPTDFLDIILEDAQAVADASADWTEDEYAENMLEAIKTKVDEISYKDPITKTYNVDLDNGIISSDDWAEIDDILMDIAEQSFV